MHPRTVVAIALPLFVAVAACGGAGAAAEDPGTAASAEHGAAHGVAGPPPTKLPPRTPPGGRTVDRDQDGVADHVDRCPDDPEDIDAFHDADGCPDPDNDQDGVLDWDDGCPNERETTNGFQDADGCPDRR